MPNFYDSIIKYLTKTNGMWNEFIHISIDFYTELQRNVRCKIGFRKHTEGSSLAYILFHSCNSDLSIFLNSVYHTLFVLRKVLIVFSTCQVYLTPETGLDLLVTWLDTLLLCFNCEKNLNFQSSHIQN